MAKTSGHLIGHGQRRATHLIGDKVNQPTAPVVNKLTSATIDRVKENEVEN
jgi:hypothetical protein